ncbi:MAG TPA: aromatic amino acid lyase [Streptosporangiaceae bacterium]
MAATHVLTAAADLDPALISLVAAGDQVTLAPELARQVDARCAAARAVLAGGQAVYGVSTGMGALSSVALTEAEQARHQANLMLGRATGGPPWLPPADVRALFAVRLATFLTGDAGVSAALCRRLTDFLAAGLVPAVPAGAAGTAGEIVPSAHAFGPLTGAGSVLTADGASVRPAGEALAGSGLGAFSLGPKEGIALLAGVPGATALSLLAEAEAATVAQMLESAAALSIAAIGAPRDPYEALCARGDEVQAAVLARLRQRLSGAAADAAAGREPRMLQAPVSFRVAGPVLAHLARSAAALAAAVRRALAGVTDSPAFTGDRFIGTAGFHGIDLAAHCDQLTAAVAHAAEVGAARTHRLLDPKVTRLPAQLAARPGPDAGLVAVHKRAAGEVHALRRLAAGTAAFGTMETSGGQEDVQSFAWAAAMNLRAALRHARLVAACEVLTAFQAATLAGGLAGGLAGSGGAGLVTAADLVRVLAGIVEPVTADRPLGPDIERLAAGSWLA